MTDIIKFLKGKKTYIVAGVYALVVFSEMVGWIDESTALIIKGFLIPTGIATLRMGVSNR